MVVTTPSSFASNYSKNPASRNLLIRPTQHLKVFQERGTRGTRPPSMTVIPVSYATVDNAARASILAKRQDAILQRLSALEKRFSLGGASLDKAVLAGHSPTPSAASIEPPITVKGAPIERAETRGVLEDAGCGPLQAKLAAELSGRGVNPFMFKRVPANYYKGCLEARRACLGAQSAEHLCKSIIMVNTRAPAAITDCSNPLHSKYYLIIVQMLEDPSGHPTHALRGLIWTTYLHRLRLKPPGHRYATAISSDKINRVVHQLANSAMPAGCAPLGRKGFNLRLCPSEVSDELSGYTHNAVTPIGCRTRIPIILSDRVLRLQPDFFWLGGGQVDLKLGFSAAQFVAAYSPLVADIC